MRIVTGLSGSLFVLALALTGCGSDSDKESNDSPSTSSGAEPLDTCTLLTAADLQKVFASPFDDGELTHQEQTGGDQCVWTNKDAPPVKTFSITVLRQDALGGAFKSAGVKVSELHQQGKDLMPDAEEIDLGDDAYLAGTTLAVLDGDTQYSFSTFLGTSDEALAGLKALAAQVVG